VPPQRLLACALVLALAVTGCSGGDDDDDKDDAETSSTEMVKAAVELDVTRAELVSPHAALGPLDGETKDAVTDVVEDLLLVTSATPLVEGKAGAGFADLFTGDAGARAAGDDRDVFFDEDVPRFGELTEEEASLELTGLAGTLDPAVQLVVAEFRWNVTSLERPLDRVTRSGDLHLIRDGDEWKIGAYTMIVTRTVDEVTTTTTATSVKEEEE
jgi:hypothetical protein